MGRACSPYSEHRTHTHHVPSPLVPVTLPTGEGAFPSRTSHPPHWGGTSPHSYRIPPPLVPGTIPSGERALPTRTGHHPQRSLQSLIAGASVKIEAFA